ncbi:MAG: DUF58 domain-containing protein [Devosia sp.]|nr:DUF58 domain-containing protein [Devosia sp.]
MEFADHRPYASGDDVRHVDARVLARLGQPYIRQYSVDRQLPILVVLDATLSMAHGEPDKFGFALTLARTLAFVGLAGGDLVQGCVFAGGRLHYSPRVQGTSRAPQLFDWFRQFRPEGRTSFAEGLVKALPHARRRSLVIVISDFLFEGIDDVLRKAGGARDLEILAVHVASPDELDPALVGSGPVYLVDAETGAEIEITLDEATRTSYRDMFGRWQDTIRSAVRRRFGRYHCFSTTTGLEQVFLHEFRRTGVIT